MDIRNLIKASLFVAVLFAASDVTAVSAQRPTSLREGTHKLTLQWIAFTSKDAGLATVIRTANGSFTIRGGQTNGGQGFVSIDGTLKELSPTELLFTGEIDTRCSYINAGKVCRKNGTFHFRTKGARKFWRLQEMKNCDGESVDYVDLYF